METPESTQGQCDNCGEETEIVPCDEYGFRIHKQAVEWANKGAFDMKMLCSDCRSD